MGFVGTGGGFETVVLLFDSERYSFSTRRSFSRSSYPTLLLALALLHSDWAHLRDCEPNDLSFVLHLPENLPSVDFESAIGTSLRKVAARCHRNSATKNRERKKKSQQSFLSLQIDRMALPGKGKKRTTTQKTSALSKRHKAAVKPETTTKTKSFKETPAVEKVPRAQTAFPTDKASKEKKDRKGKGPLFIPAVEQDSSDDDSDGAMELDEEIAGEQGDFLMALDEKGMAVYGLIPSKFFPLELIRTFFEMQFSSVSRR